MIAGPNGSGKSTLLDEVVRAIGTEALGVYVNADEIERDLRTPEGLDLTPFGVGTAALPEFLRASQWLTAKGYAEQARAAVLQDGHLRFPGVDVNSYLAAVTADFLRRALLSAGRTFTFETVMSSPSKVDFLSLARDEGYRTYLYFVATDDPEINVARVESRVAKGGHPVSRDLIVSRYHRSLGLLPDAARAATRAFVFDNSTGGSTPALIAEAEHGTLEFHTERVPKWITTAFLPDADGA